MTTVTIEPQRSTEYLIHLASDATPARPLTGSQTYYPERNIIVGYTLYWTATIAVDGAVTSVDALNATVTVDGEPTVDEPASEPDDTDESTTGPDEPTTEPDDGEESTEPEPDEPTSEPDGDDESTTGPDEPTTEPTHRVTGLVLGGADAYEITGEIQSAEWATIASGTFRINGEIVSAEDLAGSTSSSARTLVVDGAGLEVPAEYALTVAGTVEKTETEEATINEKDTITRLATTDDGGYGGGEFGSDSYGA